MTGRGQAMRAGSGTRPAYGVLVAVTSAICFGTSGPLAKGLIDSGWSSAAVTAVRLGLGSLLLAIPLILLRHRLFENLRRAPVLVVAYGILGVAVVQLSFFNAVRYLDVPIALLCEYSGIILVVVYDWLVRGRQPSSLTGLGCVVALGGLVLVILGGDGIGDVDPVGLLWAMGAAIGLAAYFILATDDFTKSGDSVDPLALAAGGLMVGTVVIAIAGAVGVLPMSAATNSPILAHTEVPWWLVALAVAGISTSLAYVTGVQAVRLLGATPASFIALVEVVASALFSWWLLGQTMASAQLIGAIVLLTGLVAVNAGGRRGISTDPKDLEPVSALQTPGGMPTPTSAEMKEHTMADILFVVTGAKYWTLADGTQHPTGFWAEEFVAPYDEFTEAGYRVVVATPGGVVPVVDEASLAPEVNGGEDNARAIAAKVKSNPALQHPIPLDSVNLDDYAAVFYPGGHGPMEDLAVDEVSGQLLTAAIDSHRPLGIVCHAPAALLAATRPDGAHTFNGYRATGFSNTEEEQTGLAAKAKWLLQDRLIELGIDYEHGTAWEPKVVVDRNLYTGQNPASSAPLAKEILTALH